MRPFPYLHFNAVCLVLVAAAVLAAATAIWAATSRRHWFWRVLAIWLMVVAPIPVRAYEVSGIFAITLPLLGITIGMLNGYFNSLDQTSPRSAAFRFPLRDIFLLTLGVALAIAAVTRWWHYVSLLGIAGGPQWGALLVQFTLAGAAFFVLTLLAWLTAARSRVVGTIGLIVSIPAFAYAIPILGKTPLFGIRIDYLPPWQALGIDFGNRPLGPAPGILVLVLTEYVLALLVTLLLSRDQTWSRNPAIRFPFRTTVALPVLFLSVIYLQMLRLTPLPPRYSTAPNNYDRLIDLMRQSEQLSKPTTTPPAPANQRRLPALIDEAVTLLPADNYLPYDPQKDVAIRNRIDHYYVDHHNRLRIFARKIDEEAGLVLAAGDRATALDYALANLRMGLMLQRGGTYFDYMFGSHCHLLAQKRLAEMRRDLTADEARRVIRAANDALNLAEDPAAVRNRSRAFDERIFNWPPRLDHVLEDLHLGSSTGLDLSVSLDAWYQRRGSTYRLLQTDLAIRLYLADHGALPKSLDDLVPDYLPTVPIDPHSGHTFLYKPAADDFLLYSVGKDGIDNAGNFTNAAAYGRHVGGSPEFPGYDFDLDSLTRP
jgi:hypothetical protein